MNGVEVIPKSYFDRLRKSTTALLKIGDDGPMPLDFEKIGAALRDARKARKLTQEEVGRKIGTSDMAISLIERGQSHGIETIEQYAAFVGCAFVLHVGPGPAAEDTSRLVAAWQQVPAEFRHTLLRVIEEEARRASA